MFKPISVLFMSASHFYHKIKADHFFRILWLKCDGRKKFYITFPSQFYEKVMLPQYSISDEVTENLIRQISRQFHEKVMEM